ncbi:MFS transporter [Liquorilactobacillus oeni]|uniref:Macrolide-efflux protein n=1 Tax=Liquorilactobacillus oeni DSM 19972 TaxID=1423777 RepID=A0A0R1M8H6_9LACO|nr:MFS transporter [Liquorilactobacillus oeni]KRL04412.1 macrolide-efflux protein [Liquorilactobacillus oeni DSM 19972]
MFIKNRNFSCLWVGFLISSLGDWLYRIALPLIILTRTGSAYHAATTFGISFIPWIVFSLVGGSLADNYAKKKILIIGNLFAAFVSLLLIFVLMRNQINFVFLYFAVFLLASVDPLIHPSFQSIIPEIVDVKQLTGANAAIQIIDNTLSIIGPLMGGSLVTLLGGSNALWIELVSFLITAVTLSGLPKYEVKEKQIIHTIKKLWLDVVEGAEYSIHQKVIFSGSMMFLFTNFALNMFEANFIFYMTESLNYPIFKATSAMALGGVGALIAGLLGSRIVNYFKAGFLLSSSTLLAGLSTLLLLINTNYIYIGTVLGIVSFFGTINVITYFTLRQKTVPKQLLGRVVSVTRMVSYASIPVGSWFGGVLLAHGQSMFTVILLAGSIRTLAGLGAKLSPLGKEE